MIVGGGGGGGGVLGAAVEDDSSSRKGKGKDRGKDKGKGKKAGKGGKSPRLLQCRSCYDHRTSEGETHGGDVEEFFCQTCYESLGSGTSCCYKTYCPDVGCVPAVMLYGRGKCYVCGQDAGDDAVETRGGS